jgi:hypothetical protein
MNVVSDKPWQQWTTFSVQCFGFSWQLLCHQYHMLIQHCLQCKGSQQKCCQPHWGFTSLGWMPSEVNGFNHSTPNIHFFYSTVLVKPDNKCLPLNPFLYHIILVHITKIYTVLMSIIIRSRNLQHDFWQVSSYNNFVYTSSAPAINEYQNHW